MQDSVRIGAGEVISQSIFNVSIASLRFRVCVAFRVADGPLARASRSVGYGLPDRRQSRSRPKYIFRERLPLHSRRFIGDGKSRFRMGDGSLATLTGRIAVP
ncbi:hypothetical protein [Paraburkholderia sacchari]|uniref:hypothetical protein n=1 Tax=Paraburkholderia sacchari TaxID=159450 RepID=UPI0039A44AD0